MPESCKQFNSKNSHSIEKSFCLLITIKKALKMFKSLIIAVFSGNSL